MVTFLPLSKQCRFGRGVGHSFQFHTLCMRTLHEALHAGETWRFGGNPQNPGPRNGKVVTPKCTPQFTNHIAVPQHLRIPATSTWLIQLPLLGLWLQDHSDSTQSQTVILHGCVHPRILICWHTANICLGLTNLYSILLYSSTFGDIGSHFLDSLPSLLSAKFHNQNPCTFHYQCPCPKCSANLHF